MISEYLSRYRIKQQILVGIAPIVVIIILLAVGNYNSFNRFISDFDKLEEVELETRLFKDIEKDLLNMQRHALVYSYIGYGGILKKVSFLQERLERTLKQVKAIENKDPEISSRLKRLTEHYYDYKDAFSEAVRKRRQIASTRKDQLQPTLKMAGEIISEVKRDFMLKSASENAVIAAGLQNHLYRIESHLVRFENAPDSSLIAKTKEDLNEMRTDISMLKKRLAGDQKSQERINSFAMLLDKYEAIALEIVNLNRVYLQLNNVVLAGFSSEMDSLIIELDDMEVAQSKQLRTEIMRRVLSSQTNYSSLSIIAICIGLISAFAVASGISQPVMRMTDALSRLAKGDSGVPIPAQNRKDELGEMAVAANAFKEMAQEVEVQRSELEEFAYRTSHDLRSPLVSSIGLLGIAEKAIAEQDNEKANKVLSLSKASLEKLELLVKDILSLTETKNVKEEWGVANVPEMIEDALTKIQNMEHFDKLKIEKHFDIQRDVMSKQGRLALIISNLLSNAVKYQDPQKQQPYIKIHAVTTANQFILSVEDNGLGVPESHRENLFLMFKRFHPKVAFGSGLGLYMMRKSAEILGGKICYEPQVEGSKFVLEVPLRESEKEL